MKHWYHPSFWRSAYVNDESWKKHASIHLFINLFMYLAGPEGIMQGGEGTIRYIYEKNQQMNTH